MKSILTIILSFLLVVSGLAQTRNVVVNTNGAVVQPTNFWSADITNARSGLGLGSAATNPASAFQPSSTVLSNIASSNGANLTNVQLTGIVGWSAITNTNSATTLLGYDTNGQVVANTGTNTLQFTNAVNFGGDFSIAYPSAEFQWSGVAFFEPETKTWSSAFSFNNTTNAATTRANLGFSTNLNAMWTSTNSSNARSSIGLNTTNNVEFNTLSIGGSGQLSIRGVAGSISFYDSIDSENVLQIPADTNPVVINSQWNNANVRSNLGLGTSDNVRFNFLTINNSTNNTVAKFQGVYGTPLEVLTTDEDFIAGYGSSNYAIGVDVTGFKVKYSSSQVDWGAPVLVSTGGTVVSPTNFWQVAPIQTLVQDFTGITVSQTNNATNARNVYVYSLATNVSGISNTIILPTNTSTFNGDEVTVIHKGTTNTTTVVRQAGSTNNLITLNKFDESIKFIRELGQWDFYHNISFVEPIQFSGTNATANAAASRTNLGLGVTNRPLFNGVVVGDIANNPTTAFIANSQSDEVHYAPDGITFYSQTNASHNIDMANAAFNNANTWTFNSAIGFGTTTNAATTRTNLGLGLPALTNTSVTNFQKAIFYTNTAPSNIGGNLGTIAAWIEIVASNGVTYKVPAYTNVP